jgi:glutamate/tyrosine decarboxylase-like PLP-dependent enzyme
MVMDDPTTMTGSPATGRAHREGHRMNRDTQTPLDTASLDLLHDALTQLDAGFADLPPANAPVPGEAAMAEIMGVVAERMTDNYPYFHPLYAGQMLKPPHPVARLAYALSQWINPNNHALDGGRASSAMEKEAVAELAAMFGWDTFLGHLTSGGTMANLEALWIARNIHPGKTVVASSQAHYTHSRISGVLGMPFESIPVDRLGRMDLDALERRLQRGGIGTVVATIGTTALGSVDPLPALLALRDGYSFRLHADAAYGGYFGLAATLAPEARLAYDRLTEVDSIVMDPHKHGLHPYGCGSVLYRDPSVGQFYKHDSPYTYFSSEELHLGEISLECSRAGASAVALWATQRLLPLTRDGEFARGLTRCRAAALALHDRIAGDDRFISPSPPELDIVNWTLRAASISKASALAHRVFDEAARQNLHLALAELPVALFDLPAGMDADRETVTCLRSVLMKPEHLDWTDEIWRLLDASTSAVLDSPGK